jgi:hypothetical protein
MTVELGGSCRCKNAVSMIASPDLSELLKGSVVETEGAYGDCVCRCL